MASRQQAMGNSIRKQITSTSTFKSTTIWLVFKFQNIDQQATCINNHCLGCQVEPHPFNKEQTEPTKTTIVRTNMGNTLGNPWVAKRQQKHVYKHNHTLWCIYISRELKIAHQKNQNSIEIIVVLVSLLSRKLYKVCFGITKQVFAWSKH